MTTATAEQPHTETTGQEAPQVPDKPSYEDINVPVIILVGVISAILTFLVIAFVQGLCYHWENSKIKSRSTEVVAMPARVEIDKQKSLLEGGEGVLPIEEAMNEVIEQYGKK